MSEVIYLIGAGASYGKRGINNKTGEEIPGEIERGLPIVNQLEPAIDRFCWSIAPYHSHYRPYFSCVSKVDNFRAYFCDSK